MVGVAENEDNPREVTVTLTETEDYKYLGLEEVDEVIHGHDDIDIHDTEDIEDGTERESKNEKEADETESEEEEEEETVQNKEDKDTLTVGRKRRIIDEDYSGSGGRGRMMNKEEIRCIAEELANILEKRAEEKKAKEKTEEKIADIWVTGETLIVCRPCSLYSKSKEVPPHFKIGLRGLYGVINRKRKTGSERSLSDISKQCKRHEKSNLHIWCTIKEKREDENKKTYDVRNEEAGLSVVRSAIKTMKRGGGSVDFLADLDLLSLTPGVVYAVKNNSRNAFFDLRDSCFEVVTNKMKHFFVHSINDIAISLDKVTVHHTSYTVVITYFFWDGRLHVILNQLTILTLEDYDADGTARMVVDTLTSTLGYSRTELANRIRHISYDGVYADTEERVAGGGCLNLVENITEQLGLAKGDISGIWDTGHNLQVVMGSFGNSLVDI